MSLIIHDFEAFIDEFQSVEDDIKMDAIGWNGRKITIIPLYNFILHNVCPKAELMKLKPFDVIQFEETNIYESYLIVFQKKKICATMLITLCYGLIKFEVTSTDGNAYLPPESLDIVEKGVNGGHKYFKDLYNCDRFNGIIVDHFFISKNFNKLFDNNFSEVGNNSEFKQIALLRGVDKITLIINDADDEQIESMDNCEILIDNQEQMFKIFKNKISSKDSRKIVIQIHLI